MLTAQRSNVAVYLADPCGLDNNRGCNSESRENLRTIAEATGGFAILNTNALEARVDSMVAENGSYYLIGYSSPAPPNDGRHHRITVRTHVRGSKFVPARAMTRQANRRRRSREHRSTR